MAMDQVNWIWPNVTINLILLLEGQALKKQSSYSLVICPGWIGKILQIISNNLVRILLR